MAMRYHVVLNKEVLTIIHLLPSNSFFGGFLVRMVSGFRGGAGLLPRREPLLSLRVGTGACARNDGFLCVIWLASTFLRPFVTSAPLFKLSNTAFMSGAFTTALADGELLAGVLVPLYTADMRWGYYKFCRKTGEFADAIGAFVDDPVRGVRRGLVGATDGAPYVITDASPLLDGWDASFAALQLQAAGLQPDSYEYRVHEVALRRAAMQVSQQRALEKAP